MINFNKDSAWDLRPIDNNSVLKDVYRIMIAGEDVVAAFKTVRDQIIFTNKRILAVDVQGITGKRKSFTTMPYSKIQYFAIQTPGFMELFPDSELYIMFSNGFTATFEFKGSVDIASIGRIISEYALH